VIGFNFLEGFFNTELYFMIQIEVWTAYVFVCLSFSIILILDFLAHIDEYPFLISYKRL